MNKNIEFPQINAFKISDDANHFRLFENNKNIGLWNEWWYANFHDSHQNLHGFLNFKIKGDIRNNGKSKKNIDFLILDNNIPPVCGSIHLEDFYADSKKCNVIMGKNTFKMVDPYTYKVHIEAKDKKVEIKLTYERLTSGFTVIFNNFFWSVPVPLAKITGIISYDNGRYKKIVNGTGYHDHDWGIFNEDKIIWNWGEIGDIKNKISIIFGKVMLNRRLESVIVCANRNQILIKMRQPYSKIEYQKMNKDLKHFYPIEEHIHGMINKSEVDIYSSALQKFGSENMDFFIAKYAGKIKKDNQSYPINAVGFLEYKYSLEYKRLRYFANKIHRFYNSFTRQF